MSGAFQAKFQTSGECTPRAWADVGYSSRPTSIGEARTPPHRASRRPLRAAGSSLPFAARWAALGCEETSRHSSTTKGEKARQPAPRCSRQSVCSRVIQATSQQPHSFLSIAFGAGCEVVSLLWSGQGEEITLSGPYDPPQRFTKQRVGGFHQSSLNSHSRSEPFV